MRGGKGKNIAADLHMEHLNKQFKESNKSSGGQLTEDTLARHSEMLGLQHVLSDMFNEQLASAKPKYTRKKGAADISNEINSHQNRPTGETFT